MSNPLISVVSPEYYGAKMVHELVTRIIQALQPITENYEVILVNDCSPDDTWVEICKECKRDKRVKGINLSRNFGQHYAITAGLTYASGDWVIVMDCDLQDDPAAIPLLFNKAQSGFDYVQVRRVNKKFGFWKRATSSLFHRVFDWLSGTKTDAAIGNYGIFSKQVVSEMIRMPERIRSLAGLLRYVGFYGTFIEVEHGNRAEGSSSYTLPKLVKFAIELIVADSNKPLMMAVTLGFAISCISFLLAIYNIVARLIGIITLKGYTSTVFSIWFVGGLILFVLGIIGLYLGRVFDQVKGRQIFIVKETVNVEK